MTEESFIDDRFSLKEWRGKYHGRISKEGRMRYNRKLVYSLYKSINIYQYSLIFEKHIFLEHSELVCII